MKSAKHREMVKRLPCEICVRFLGVDAEPWSEPIASDAHHPRTGVGAARKSSDLDCVALCKEHHQGGTGIHGMGRRAFERHWGVTEMELVDSTQERVEQMKRGH